MLIFNETNEVTTIDSIVDPILTDTFWVLDLKMQDFTLTPLQSIEEMTSSAIRLNIDGFEFVVPTTWNVLIIDPDTSQLDIVDVSHIPGVDFSAFVYGHTHNNVRPKNITATQYYPSYVSTYPILSKDQMLCHPIAPSTWINIAPTDAYNKYLKNLLAGDLI